ncbi:GIY-YIG nuclease family protein, partial [candidate division KSB1 bacterium]
MRKSISKHLLDKLDGLPRKPGVYMFSDSSEKIIYIGKAKVLRNRVRSYFQEINSGSLYSKTRLMVKKIQYLNFIVTDTEKEALILEANLVKEYNPRYNINLKDDKSFPFIRITNEDYPRVFSTRKKINDGSQYYGPYTEAKVMRSLLWTMRRIFPVRSCQYNLNKKTVSARKYQICLDYHIKRCAGPCEALVSRDEYNEMIIQIRNFLQGHTRGLTNLLSQKMHEAASQQAFELAADYRDRLREIETFQS